MEDQRAKPAVQSRTDHHQDDLRHHVASAMARAAAGDDDAAWDLLAVAQPALLRVLQGEARRLDVVIPGDELIGMTIDAALELCDLAGSWDPEGALPWVWAHHRVRGLVHDHIGTFADELDDSHLDLEAPPRAVTLEAPREVLRRVAERHPAAHRLEQRLRDVASDRDANVWLRVQEERAIGNRAPAVTVAAEHDMRPETVRKVVQRVGERLGHVA